MAGEWQARVHVNIPFTWLMRGYLEVFLREGLRPEIGLDAGALDRYASRDFEAVAQAFRQRGLPTTLHAPFMDLSPGSPDPKVRDLTRRRLDQALRLVPVFRPRTLVCHAGYDWRRYGGGFEEEWRALSLETWRSVAGRLKGQGTVLVLENVYERGPEEMRDLMEALAGDGVRFCLDTGHLNAFGKASAREWIQVLGAHIGQLHLHDNRGQGDEHLALGRGSLDFPTIFQNLRRILEAPPVVTLEPHDEADLVPSLRALEAHWPW